MNSIKLEINKYVRIGFFVFNMSLCECGDVLLKLLKCFYFLFEI